MSRDLLVPGDKKSDGLLTFERFDVGMSSEWIESVIGQKITTEELRRLDDYLNPAVMVPAYELAKKVAEKLVADQCFPQAFKLSHQRSKPPEAVARIMEERQKMADQGKLPQSGPPLTVGVVGHRWNRLPSSEPEMARIRQQLAAAFDEIQEGRLATDMVLITGLAEGTDRIAAEAALGRGWQLVASLPFSLDRYIKDFETQHSRAEFERLRGRASRVIEAPQADSYADQDLGYAEQGRGLVAASDAIVTVWDGKDAHGTGGTAEIVALAIAKGTRVYWISTEAGAAMKRL